MKAPIECSGLGRAPGRGEALGACLGTLCLPLPRLEGSCPPKQLLFPRRAASCSILGQIPLLPPIPGPPHSCCGPCRGRGSPAPRWELSPVPCLTQGRSQGWEKGTGEQLQGDRGGCGAQGMPSLQGSVQVLLEPVVRASKHPCDPSSTGKAAPTPAPSPDLSAEVSPQAWQENKEGNMSTITEITIALMHYQAQ